MHHNRFGSNVTHQIIQTVWVGSYLSRDSVLYYNLYINTYAGYCTDFDEDKQFLLTEINLRCFFCFPSTDVYNQKVENHKPIFVE